jgi:hypothetical protein
MPRAVRSFAEHPRSWRALPPHADPVVSAARERAACGSSSTRRTQRPSSQALGRGFGPVYAPWPLEKG